MPLLIRSSSITRTDRAAIAVVKDIPADIEVPNPPLLWPRWVQTGPNTGRTVFERIPPSRIPAGWQSIRFTMAHRRATCEEVDCPMFLKGWTEVLVADGNRLPKAGQVTREEAAAEFGLYGPKELAPQTIHHPPGTECPRVHKTAVRDIPPLYTVNGRPTLWNEFEDALAGGVHRAQQLRAEGTA